MSAENKDRRDSARSPLCMAVRCGDDFLWAWDLGLGGLQCRSRRPWFPGTYLDMEFTIPGGEAFKVGGQVASLDQAPDGGLSFGIRFCRPPAQLRLAIYRFLDQRRRVWDPERSKVEPPLVVYDPDARPFEGLLLEAFATMRLREQQLAGFVRRSPSRDLEILGRILARDTIKRAA